ncbi:MAG: alcohol dehydrogenase catalytic domain-containing protein [Celeribacter sp.]
MRVRAVGIDGTDLKLCKGIGYAPRLPFIMGHEFAGEVVEIGSDVQNFRVGDRAIPYIFVSPLAEDSRKHRDQMDPEIAGVIGIDGFQGGYAEYVCVAEAQLVRLPDNIEWADGAVLCDGGLTAYHAVDRAQILPGQRVAMIGVGGVGAFAIQIAALAGADILALDRVQSKLDWAETLAAGVQTSLVEGEPQAPQTHAATCDHVLDFVGNAATFELGKRLLDRNGRYVFVGYGEDTITLSPKELSRSQWTILGTRGGSRADLAAVIDLAASGKIISTVTDQHPLREVNEALSSLSQGRVLGRCVLCP